MRFQDVRQSLHDRIRNPAYWVGLLSLGLLTLSFMVMLVREHLLGNILRTLAFSTIWLPAIFLSPLPWQWTGDDRPLAPWWRGLLQVIGFALVICLLHALLVVAFRSAGGKELFLGIVTGLAATALMTMAPLGIMIARSEHLSREVREAKARARQAQWMSHRGAFSPRLLFGNLDHLADLAHRDPGGTEQGLVDLAALYRHWLVEAEKPVIPLGNEVRMAEQYLALEQKRWKQQLQVRTHFDLEQYEQAVPPLLLLSFLEQSLTGDPADFVEMDVRVSGTATTVELHLEVQGPVPAPSLEAMNQSKRRIQTTLDREGSVALTSSESGWALAMSIPKRATEALS